MAARKKETKPLLTTRAKRAFFAQLDAFLGAPGDEGRRRAPATDAYSTATAIATASAATAAPGSTIGMRHYETEPMRRGVEAPPPPSSEPTPTILLPVGNSNSVKDKESQDTQKQDKQEQQEMQPGSPRKRTSRAPEGVGIAAKKTKRVCSSPKADGGGAQLLHGPLQGQRVLLVPLGADVSRKRLEIWTEMVHALGGYAVSVTQASSQTPRHAVPQLQLHGHSHSHGNSDEPGLAHRQNAAINWEQVDLAIVSTTIDREKLARHYGGDGPTEQVKLFTPEWLAYLKREHKLPADERVFDWRRLQEHTDGLQVEEKAAGAHGTTSETNDRPYRHEAESGEDESGGEDGSDACKESTREIVRAPPVHVDADKLLAREEELRKQKEKLVNERRPIFHKLNPRFEVISGGIQDRHPKAEAFVCQTSSLTQANLNAHITGPLEELMEFLHVERDIWRQYSYKKIVSSLKAMRSRICSVRDLKDVWWAKGRMREKVVEILDTGRLEKLEAKKANPRLRALVEMARIWGVGPATAAKLYNMGYKSLDDLRQRGDKDLSDQQRIGLRYYQDFLTKIPRPEVQQMEQTVVDEVHRLLPGANAFACGSYRRGKLSSGDCDVLITDPDSEECDILPELLRRLHASGFLTDDLTHVPAHHMGGCDTYMGVCQVSKDLPHRRLDIKVYPRRSFGFALLYFTGSDHFNRSMRLYARKKGWSLSDRGLKRVVRVRKGTKIETGEGVTCPNEVDVFIALGLQYKDPTERNCFDMRFLEEDEALAKRGGPSGATRDKHQ